MTRPRLLLDTVPLYRLLRGDSFLQRLVKLLRGCGYHIGSTEAVLVETLYFVEKSGGSLMHAASLLLGLLDAVEALRERPLSSPLLERLGYADAELLMAAMGSGGATLLTGDEPLALEAQGRGVNAYAVDWLYTLGPEEAASLLCPFTP